MMEKNDYLNFLNDRVQSFPEPLHLSTSHTLSKVSLFIPFPSEVEPEVKRSECFDPGQAKQILTNEETDPNMVDYLAVLLSDTLDDLSGIELKQTNETSSQTDDILLSPLVKSLLSVNQYALQTSSNFDYETQHTDKNAGTFNQNKKTLFKASASIVNGQIESGAPDVSITNVSTPSTSQLSSGERSCQIEVSGEIKSSNKRKRNSVNAAELVMESPIVQQECSSKESLAAMTNRPPTPVEIIHQREIEWMERQRLRKEKLKRRREVECWNNDEAAQNESMTKFSNYIDRILEKIDEKNMDDSSTVFIEPDLFTDLRNEANKLKSWRKLNKINSDKLVKLLMVLEKIVRDVMDEDGMLTVRIDTEDGCDIEKSANNLAYQRLVRSLSAGSLALIIMTSSKMPKQIIMDGAIERSIQICKESLAQVLYPAIAIKAKSKKDNFTSNSAKRRRTNEPASLLNTTFYHLVVELVRSFAELARFHTLEESVVVQLVSLATPPFFIENVPEIQIESIKLLSISFSKCAFLRKTILYDLINSLHRLPLTRVQKNCYRLNSAEWIGNFTVLYLQLIQAIVKGPSKKHTEMEDGDNETPADSGDQMVLDSYDEAKRMASFFLGGFLTKCTAKSEEDYRRLFEQFLQDLLTVLYKPEWPSAELLLSMLANILVKNIIEKSNDISLRVASLDYLGTITARLRKERIAALSESNTDIAGGRLDLVVKSIVYDESNDQSKNVEDIEISHLSSTEKVRKLEQALIDYIIGKRCVGISWNADSSSGGLDTDSDISVEYILNFYIVEWYRETVLDVELSKQRYNEATKKNLSQKELQKYNKKLERIIDKGRSMKEFILSLIDRRYLKKRMQIITKTSSILIDSDADWVVRYLASKKELTQSFDLYLEKILKCFGMEYPVAIRAKAMKCLAQLVEVDYQILMLPEVNKIVQDRLIDANASVREATFDLIGKFLVLRPDLLSAYYLILINRIRDSAIAVRKRVIRILRDIVKDQPQYEHHADILAELVNRINDEESVKKLCYEIFQQIWFVPLMENQKSKLREKVFSIVDTCMICTKKGSIENFESLLTQLFKTHTDKSMNLASVQIVDELVNVILSLDADSASDDTDSQETKKSRHLASLTALSVFAKFQPGLLTRHIELFVPYLTISFSNDLLRVRVLNQIISMLERVVPLIDYPSDSLLQKLDSRLNDIVRDGQMVSIAFAISCMNAIYNKFQRIKPGISSIFLIYLKYLEKLKSEVDGGAMIDNEKIPTTERSLYSIGIMCRYFNFDKLLSENLEKISESPELHASNMVSGLDSSKDQNEKIGILHSRVFNILFFFARKGEFKVSQKAMISLGQFSAGCSLVLQRAELKKLYMLLLETDMPEFLQLKIQVLKNLSCFLYAEEERSIKHTEEFKKIREEQKQQGKAVDDLKEMELGVSGLSSSIIQNYSKTILKCYFHANDTVRLNAAQVILQTLEQGLVTPGTSIPTVISMITDPISNLRARVEGLIKELNSKYKGLIISKAIPGVRLSYALQKKIGGDSRLIRGIRHVENPLDKRPTPTKNSLPKNSNEVQSLLANFYAGIRTNRSERRSFLSAILRLFSEDLKEKIDIGEWLYLADNIAHFPYQVVDEPLYLIHKAESIISLTGQNIIGSLKQLMIPETQAQRELANGDSGESFNDDEEFSVAYISEHLPTDMSQIYELKRNSQACYILLYLKNYLMRAFGLKKEKVTEYSPSEAASVYEKPTIRKIINVFSPDSVLSELKDDKISNTKLAEHFCNFYEMLLFMKEELDTSGE